MYCIYIYLHVHRSDVDHDDWLVFDNLHVHRSDVDHDDWLVFDNILEVLVEVC